MPHVFPTVCRTQLPHAVGAAYALKMDRKDACAVTYFGDGGSSEVYLYQHYQKRKIFFFFFFQNADENIMGKYVQKILIVIVFEMSLFHFLYVSIAYKGR